MNLQNIAKREILDFAQFRAKVHDDHYNPFSEENQTPQPDKTGLSPITRQPAYDHVGYANAVFGHKSKIDVPGIRLNLGAGMADAFPAGSAYSAAGSPTIQESEDNSFIKKLSDFV